MDKRLVRLSKFLSYVLRHRPESIGLSLDGGGWARCDELLAAVRRAGVSLDEGLLLQVVEQSEKKRFSFSDDGLRIRANYGHSISVDLELQPVVPPEFLYHGTARRCVASIRRQGLRREGRNYVHLSPDEHTAVGVGKRHGRSVILVVKARRMHHAGVTFYRSESGVWLTEKVPPEHILFPENRCS
jgi:putative RNA 2'-phosphotransferase